MAHKNDIPDILLQLVSVRHKAKITQAEIAIKMDTTASAVARLESGGGSKKHSPSLRTLGKYAGAMGKGINMDLFDIEEAA